jgi:hypothetical protein
MNEFEKQLAGHRFRSVPAEWREEILNAAKAHRKRARPVAAPEAVPWLYELLWPRPGAWGALAGAWIVIVAFHVLTPRTAPADKSGATNVRVLSVAEQRRELAEILNPLSDAPEHHPANRPRSAHAVPWKPV